MTFHHIGIACYDIEKSSQFYLAQGYKKTETVYDPIQNVNICFCENLTGTGICVELISPKDDTSPVNKNLHKNGVSPYHICYETENLEKSILELKKQKFLVVTRPAPAVAFGGRRVCFLFNKAVGLIELVESESY
ncbi:VOC family protein [Treponema socranskii]|uniref:VOC family protein n=1 Tax=Treponema socranskii TaxID=53419 RepID=UPI003D8B71DC